MDGRVCTTSVRGASKTCDAGTPTTFFYCDKPSIFLPDITQISRLFRRFSLYRCLLHLCVTKEALMYLNDQHRVLEVYLKKFCVIVPPRVKPRLMRLVPCSEREVACLRFSLSPDDRNEKSQIPLNIYCCRVFQKAYVYKTYHVRAPYASAPPRRHGTATYDNHPPIDPPTHTSLSIFAEFRPTCRPTKLAILWNRLRPLGNDCSQTSKTQRRMTTWKTTCIVVVAFRMVVVRRMPRPRPRPPIRAVLLGTAGLSTR